jgi:hypothetical protein
MIVDRHTLCPATDQPQILFRPRNQTKQTKTRYSIPSTMVRRGLGRALDRIFLKARLESRGDAYMKFRV